MSLNVPEFMPVLSAGAHESPAEGACIMEYASFLNGEEWTDMPSCTNHVLARAAQYVNDDIGDEKRQALLPLLPRLMGTTVSNSTVDWAIAEAAADYVKPLIGHAMSMVHEMATEAQDGLGGPNPRFPVGSAEIAVAMSGGDAVAFLSHLIDAYDEATGRTEPATVTADDLRRCAELTGAKA